MIYSIGIKNFSFHKKQLDNEVRIIIPDVTFDYSNKFLTNILKNLYNASTAAEQSMLSNLLVLLEKFDLNRTNGSFSRGILIFFYSSLNTSRGGGGGGRGAEDSDHAEKLLAKLFELKEKFDLCDIWRIRNPKTKRYTFKQNHATGFFKPRLAAFLFQNGLELSVENTFILTSVSTDRSAVFLCFQRRK